MFGAAQIVLTRAETDELWLGLRRYYLLARICKSVALMHAKPVVISLLTAIHFYVAVAERRSEPELSGYASPSVPLMLLAASWWDV